MSNFKKPEEYQTGNRVNACIQVYTGAVETLFDLEIKKATFSGRSRIGGFIL